MKQGIVSSYAAYGLTKDSCVSHALGAQKDYLKDLEKLVKQEKVSELPTSTLEIKAEGIHSDAAEGTHCFFAGLGYDARMLQAHETEALRLSGTSRPLCALKP